jgi:hypothetical protein
LKADIKKIAEHPAYIALLYLIAMIYMYVFFTSGGWWLLLLAIIFALSNTLNLYGYLQEKNNVVGR